MPHNNGSGPIRANQPVVIDIFPQSLKTGYYADISRTVVKGKASDELKRMYNAVKEAQNVAFGMIKGGVDGNKVYDAVVKYFEKKNFKNYEKDGKQQGFIHGLGHGVGWTYMKGLQWAHRQANPCHRLHRHG